MTTNLFCHCSCKTIANLGSFRILLSFWCRIHLWFRYVGGLYGKSMTSSCNHSSVPSRLRAQHRNIITTRWRLCVTMETLQWQQYGGYALLDFYIFNSTVVDWTCCFFFFPRTSWCVGVLNSATFLTVFTIGLSFARFWRAFGISGGLNPPNAPPVERHCLLTTVLCLH